MLEGRGLDLASSKTSARPWEPDPDGRGFLFPSPHRTQEGNGVAAEVTRFQATCCVGREPGTGWVYEPCVPVCVRVGVCAHVC